MTCKNFGTGLIVLSATLFLGITAGGLLNLTEIPDIEVIGTDAIPLNKLNSKNCVPKDKNLKYRNLGDDETVVIPIPEKKQQTNAERVKEPDKNSEGKSDIERKMENLEKQAEKFGSEFQTLVYREECRRN